MGGCIEVLRRLPVAELWWTGQTDTSFTWRTFWSEVGTRGIPLTRIVAGQVYDWGEGATATIYNPIDHSDGSPVNEYDDSHVVLVEYMGTRLLFVGDLHRRGELRALAAGLGAVDILKVAEHGSASGTSAEFLSVVKPRIAIVSYALPNAFGLPNPLVLTRLATAGVTPLMTSERGTVTITVDGYAVSTEH
jgi:competence protein ComEC